MYYCFPAQSGNFFAAAGSHSCVHRCGNLMYICRSKTKNFFKEYV
jgi:hypothetical protein